MKKLLSLILCGLIASSCVLVGCNSESNEDSSSESEKSSVADPIEGITATASKDKYRNYYEIFVNSFADSNDDGTGDLQGIISQLDYLNDGDPNSGDDLGIDGIWLTPIMPSQSYHKYDVEDYYNIDPSFGTLDDFDKLIEECHKRGINVIIDLVLNHISSENPLYKKAVEEVAENKLDGNAEYFEIYKSDSYDADKVNELANGYVCEANFSHSMPEWNLNSKKTRAEFEKIAKFWIDRGVDGFRLDAVKYYDSDTTDGTEFLKWFETTCKKLKDDIYIVGENWSDDTNIKKFYESGIDSQFAFKFSQPSGEILMALNTQQGSSLVNKVKKYEKNMKTANENMINAMFLSNHDMARVSGGLISNGINYAKFAASVYMLFPGNPFIYYGEEIGTPSTETTSDAYYRTPMVFDSDNLPKITVDNLGNEVSVPKNGGVKQQLSDKDSLLNFYRRVIKIKNQNSEIARGTITGTQSFEDSQVGAYYVEYDGKKLLIIHNFSKEESKDLTVSDDMMKNAYVRADLVTNSYDDHIEMKDGKVTVPALSTVIIGSK